MCFPWRTDFPHPYFSPVNSISRLSFLACFLVVCCFNFFIFAFQDPQTCLELGHLLSLSSSSSFNFFLPIIKYTIEKSAIKIDIIFCHAGKEAFVREKWASSCQDFCFRGQQLPYFRPIYCLPLFLHHHALACLD